MTQYEKFNEQYAKCIDENGEPKLCGRYACIDLISLCNEIEPEVEHGDLVTGFMRVDSIVKLHKKVNDFYTNLC